MVGRYRRERATGSLAGVQPGRFLRGHTTKVQLPVGLGLGDGSGHARQFHPARRPECPRRRGLDRGSPMVAASAIAADWRKRPASKPGASASEHRLDPAALGDHIDRLFRAAWSMCGSREEAEDLVQETFARVLRKPRIQHSEDDLVYLLRVLLNTLFSTRRSAARRPQTTPLPDDLDRVEDRSAP